jgi:hypothetical protein
MKSSADKDSAFTDVYGNVGIGNTFCYDISGGTRCDCPGFREGAGEQPPWICQCGHVFCVHDIVRASVEITCRLLGSVRSLVCVRGLNQKIIDFGLDGSWAARVKLVPSVRLAYNIPSNSGLREQGLSSLAAYFRLESRGLIRTVRLPGVDSRSIVRAVTDSFGDILGGRRWMPLKWHGNSRRLEPDQIDPSAYGLEFLIERCITDWPGSTSSTVSFDITLEDESLSWKQISRLPEVGRNYEIFWELNDSLDSNVTSGSDLDGGGEVVERSVRLNKASLVNQVLVYIRCLVRGIIATSGWVVEHTDNYEQPRGTIGRTTSGGSSNLQSRKHYLDADEHQSKNTPSDEEDGERNNGRGGMSSRKGELKPKCNFACPFFKYNPRKYMCWRSCPGPGWKTVHRIKYVSNELCNFYSSLRVIANVRSREHLYRRHALPKFVCDCCFEPFQDADSLRLHHRAEMPCPVREEPQDAFEGVTPAQEVQLRSRKRSRIGVRDTGHEKWIHIYQVLFPEETRIPSPCKSKDFLRWISSLIHSG